MRSRGWKTHDLVDLFNSTERGYLPLIVHNNAWFNKRDWHRIHRVDSGRKSPFANEEEPEERDMRCSTALLWCQHHLARADSVHVLQFWLRVLVVLLFHEDFILPFDNFDFKDMAEAVRRLKKWHPLLQKFVFDIPKPAKPRKFHLKTCPWCLQLARENK